jgi:co-chaperonin GroES (HSP10)
MKGRYLLVICLLALFVPVLAQKSEKAAVVTVAQDQGVTITLKNKTLQLANVKVGDKIQILNILGVRVLEKKADSTIVDIALDLPQGYYIVKVGTTVRKISLK